MDMIFQHWQFQPGECVLTGLLLAGYGWTTRLEPGSRKKYFFAAMAIFAIAVFSPLHYAGMHYLVSAHMVSHVLLVLVVPPLLVAGLPRQNAVSGPLQKISEFLGRVPVAAWLTGVGIMWVWHIPAVFHQLMPVHAMAGEGARMTMGVPGALHLVSLLLAGCVFSWPIINPYRETRLHPVAASLYLSAACIFCSLLGLLITFAPTGLYTDYLPHTTAYFNVQQGLGITEKMDQQAAGLIMWVPCCLVYLTGVLLLLHHWLQHSELRYPSTIKTLMK